MLAPLLTTKLYIPPPRPRLVPRPRLLQRLDEGLRLGHRLTLVSAPAGFGKTTLITEWVCGLPREVAWLSLDEGDNDPAQFVNYLVAALQQVDGQIGQAVQQILAGPQLPPPQGLVTALINDVTNAGVALTLVLDDYQLITAEVVHDTVRFLLENLPPRMHLVIGTRQDPPLPLHRLRVGGQITELRERDLRFTEEEGAAFLTQTMGLDLSSQAVTALEARTEGWIAGLQLAALALQERQGAVEGFIAAFTGDDRYITDYLVSEVLQRQPEAVREFLFQTAILDRLSAPLCNAVSGREDGQAMLEHLEAVNLFLVPLDHRREWYRYHRLFAEVLRTALDQEVQVSLHQRAAEWYESNGYLDQAIRHAQISAQATGDWQDAVRLVRRAAEDTLHQGGLNTVRRWLDALPDELVRANGDLATDRGWVLAFTGELPVAGEYADVAEEELRRAGHQFPRPDRLAELEPDADVGRLLALRSFIAVFAHQDYDQAIALATGALQVLDEGQARWRIMALWTLAESQERTAPITEAIATLREAQRAGRLLGAQVFAVTVELFLATALHNHGKRRGAVAVCEEGIRTYSDRYGRPSPVTGLLLSRLGTLYYEANQLEQARERLDQGLALCDQLGLESSTMFSYAYAAPTLDAQGETEAALEALAKSYRYAIETGLADAEWSLALEAQIRLQRGDLSAAQRWAESARLSPDDEPHFLRVEQQLVYVRLLLIQGRLSDARRMLARMERFTWERGLFRWLITIHILQALVADRSGSRDTALDRLASALEMAAPEDYVRAFLVEGPRVAQLLPGVRHVAPAFVDGLLSAATDQTQRLAVQPPVPSSAPAVPVSQPMVDPLSEREREVLHHIAAGLTNREIAQELFIAIGTVKRHINNIYGKMNVHSRTQAIARARELGLIP